MSKSKLLNLSKEQLIKIAEAINKNTISNRSRDKEKKMGTDMFLKKFFKINRKDFSHTIKTLGVNIEYNPSTFLYDIGSDGNYKNSTTEVLSEVAVTFQANEKKVTEDNTKVINYENNTSVVNKKLKDAIPILLEMVEWYKLQKKDKSNVVDVQPIELNINNISEEFKDAIGVHSIKAYESIYNKFNELCNQHKQYKKYDLVSLALLEFVNKYKK